MGITIQLWRHRKALHTPTVRRRYGFLYDRFHEGAEFWEVIEVARKVTLMGLTGFLNSVQGRVFSCTLISVVALALLCHLKPHRNKTVLTVEVAHFSITTYKYLVLFMAIADETLSSTLIFGFLLAGDIIFLCLLCWVFFSIGCGRLDKKHLAAPADVDASQRGTKPIVDREGKSENHSLRKKQTHTGRNLTELVGRKVTDTKMRKKTKVHEATAAARDNRVEENMTQSRQRLQNRLKKRNTISN